MNRGILHTLKTKKELIPLAGILSFAAVGAFSFCVYSLFCKSDVIIHKIGGSEPWQNIDPAKPQKRKPPWLSSAAALGSAGSGAPSPGKAGNGLEGCPGRRAFVHTAQNLFSPAPGSPPAHPESCTAATHAGWLKLKGTPENCVVLLKGGSATVARSGLPPGSPHPAQHGC
ncbi:normal mucosa of esophagus-specific gene 1 protein isoform X2 [Motacilla alba alba]|uniref:normal mucosa of esophagus-specific gene 1 protein isoform X2 n=1 Tax=Motacilla alba alba TaxID=1094192 RepID=UPI0018D56C63|nr:normal mucosa of esophagus-specific gene 1 protein isoform X2 [Motacilla alba alba]